MATKLAEAYIELSARGLTEITNGMKRIGPLVDAYGSAWKRSESLSDKAARAQQTMVRQITAGWSVLAGPSGPPAKYKAILQGVDLQHRRLAVGVKNATNQVSGDMGRMTSNGQQRLFELSRGIEDAALGYHIRGFSGLVMSTSNNLSRMAELFAMSGKEATGFKSVLMGFAPFLPLFISLGTAIYLISQSWGDVEGATLDATRAQERYNDRIKEWLSLQQGRRDFQRQLDDLQGPDQAGRLVGQRGNTVEDQQANLVALKRRLEANQTQIAGNIRPNEATAVDFEGAMADFRAEQRGLLNERAAIRQQIIDAQHALAQAQMERAQAEIRQAELVRQANFGQNLADVGGFFSSIPSQLAPGMESLDRFGESMEDMAEQSRRDAKEREAERQAIHQTMLQRNAERFRRGADQAKSRQSEFGGIGDLARRLQERANAKQEQLLGNISNNSNVSAEALRAIEQHMIAGLVGRAG